MLAGINISKTKCRARHYRGVFLSPELTLLAVRSWPGLQEVRTGPTRPLTEAEDLPGSGLPAAPALAAAAVIRAVQLGPV